MLGFKKKEIKQEIPKKIINRVFQGLEIVFKHNIALRFMFKNQKGLEDFKNKMLASRRKGLNLEVNHSVTSQEDLQHSSNMFFMELNKGDISGKLLFCNLAEMVLINEMGLMGFVPKRENEDD